MQFSLRLQEWSPNSENLPVRGALTTEATTKAIELELITPMVAFQTSGSRIRKPSLPQMHPNIQNWNGSRKVITASLSWQSQSRETRTVLQKNSISPWPCLPAENKQKGLVLTCLFQTSCGGYFWCKLTSGALAINKYWKCSFYFSNFCIRRQRLEDWWKI